MKIKFSDLFFDDTKNGVKLKTIEYSPEGKFPIIDQGQKYIAAYTNRKDGVYKDVPVIVFGDHTRIIKFIDRPFFLGADGVKILKPKKRDIDLKYLYYALESVHIPDTGYNRHFKWLKGAYIPVFSLEINNKIVKTLDKITVLHNKYAETLTLLDELIKSRFVEMFSPINNLVRLKDICSIITDGTHQPPKFVSKGIPFIFVSNIINDTIDLSTDKYIDESTYQTLIKRTPIEIGDLILSTVGSYGHPAVVKTKDRFLFQRHIAYLKPIQKYVRSEYLHSAMQSDFVQRQIKRQVKGIAQKTLNLTAIKELIISIPPLSEQIKFIKFKEQAVKSRMAVQKSLDELEILKKSLLQEYFG